MMSALQNQTVVVIGASSGLGEAVATLAQEQGARVVGFSRSGTAPRGVQGVAVDVTDSVALAAALAGVGTIDHLAHTAAARTPSIPLESLDDDSLLDAFAPKLFGAIHAVRAALPYLTERASITLTSGQVSRKYGTGTLIKGAVNGAIEAAGRHLAKELAPRRVNVVSPGVADTALWGEPESEKRRSFLAAVSSKLPVGRVARPREIAEAYLFAMTNDFANGAVLDIDGGGLL
jgi:NAD(P)-dependent dehydrogenase (short-subunit alcohol dehydrogenase family)